MPTRLAADSPGRLAVRTGSALVRLDAELVSIRGADALAYLQTKLTADTRTWAASGGGRAIATDINGRSVASGWFVVVADDALVAIVPTGHAAPLAEHLDRFVIMEDVVVEATTGPVPWLAVGEAATTWATARPEPGLTTAHGPWPARALLAGADDRIVADAEAAGLVVASAADLDAEEVVAGIPADAVELATGASIPLEAGAWDRISFAKGCYLGQEVIERLHSRGTPARRLCRLAVTASVGDPVERADRTVGEITRVADGPEGPVALAWIKRKGLEAPAELRVADAPVQSLQIVRWPHDADR